MYNLSLSKIALIIQAKLIVKEELLEEVKISEPLGASIDTRKLEAGEIFFALKGERVDGHDFLSEAHRLGASAAVVEYIPEDFQIPSLPLLLVQDAEKALQQLASVQRSLLEGPVIAITGSTGKTTTKDILRSILLERGDILSTQGNYNNQLGLPLTLLALKEKHWAMVLEMGMDSLGEIDFLARVARPTHGIVTNIGHAHQEILGSQQKIAQAKAELFPYLSKSGGVVLNRADEEILNPWLANLNCPISWVDLDPPGDLWVMDIQPNRENYGFSFLVCNEFEQIPLTLNIPGKHNVFNSLAAISVARKLGLSWEEIRAGLEKVSLTPMRLEIIQLPEQELTLINDVYNANPASMASALGVLESVAGNRRKIAVLGDMYELGDYSVQGHQEVGNKVQQIDPAYLVTVGELSQEIGKGAIESGFPQSRTRVFLTNHEAVSYLKSILRPGDVILIKGSRGVQMEEITMGLSLDS